MWPKNSSGLLVFCFFFWKRWCYKAVDVDTWTLLYKPRLQQLLKSLATRPAHPQPKDTECAYFSVMLVWLYIRKQPTLMFSVLRIFQQCSSWWTTQMYPLPSIDKTAERWCILGTSSAVIEKLLGLCDKDKYFWRQLLEHPVTKWISRASISLSTTFEKLSRATEPSWCRIFSILFAKAERTF